MTFLKLCVVLLFGMVLSAYHHYSSPNTLPQYHRTVEIQDNSTNFCGVTTSYSIDSLTRVGKALFKNNCAACHNKNMRDDLNGPALKGVEERWSEYPKDDLYRWIRNSEKLIADGHPKAVEVFKANNED